MDKKLIERDLKECEEIIQIAEKLLFSDSKIKEVSSKLSIYFKEIKNDLQDQQKRLKKDVYEIAVVGREKSGKSTLLNAWMNFDLLPTNRKRCTYTTTEIRSCSLPSEQKYCIEYLTNDEFDIKLNKTREEKRNFSGKITIDLLQQELHEIDLLFEEINTFLGRSNVDKHFNSFNEVRDELNSAISNPGQARAIKKVCIWTQLLNSDDNIVLYDLPGYDSPITIHKEQTKEKLASVDAILFAKQINSIDLVDSETDILKINDSSNPFTKSKDKIIVVLTNCDAVNSKNDYIELMDKHKKTWELSGVDPSRIISVCSIIESGLLSEEIENVKNKLQLLEIEESIGNVTQLKYVVKMCVEESKNKLVKDRCHDLKIKIKDFASQLCRLINNVFNIDSKNDLTEPSNESSIFHEWWKHVFFLFN